MSRATDLRCVPIFCVNVSTYNSRRGTDLLAPSFIVTKILEYGPVASGDSEIGQEGVALRIFDQMQDARKEVALGLRAADINDACVPEFVIKEPQDAITRIVVQRVESFVNHHQTRLVQ